ncbi:MAG: chromosomal replication initiator protein DnaA, partial [Micropepsaceae bacterium]
MADDWGQVVGEDTEYWTYVRGKFGDVIARQWARVKGHMRDEFGVPAFNSWLKPMTLAEAREDKVRLAVPTRFMRDWIEENFGPQLLELWQDENEHIGTVEIIVSPGRTRIPCRPEAPQSAKAKAPAEAQAVPVQLDKSFSAVLDARFTFANFVVGRSNELAHAAARRVADSDEVPFNPLFLYGGVGLGKTHLMHAIAQHISKRNPKRRVLYLSGEKFMNQLIRAIQFKTTMTFKEQFRSVDVLMIDDVQFISGKNHTQEEFFHTFNDLVDQRRQIVVSADKSPSDLEGMEDRLKSRLGWGLVAD